MPVSFWSEGATDRAGKRFMSPPCWLETNIVQFGDPEHIWHDPQGKALHLWMRAHTGGAYAFSYLVGCRARSLLAAGEHGNG